MRKAIKLERSDTGKTVGEVAGAYARRTALGQDIILPIMDAKIVMSAKEMEAKGFVDQIVGGVEVTASAVPSWPRSPWKAMLERLRQETDIMASAAGICC